MPLSAFSRYEPTNTPLAVNHQGQFVASTISFNLAPGESLSDATRAVDRALARLGVPTSIHGGFPGHGAGVPGLARQPAVADPGGADHRLYRAGHPVRELRPSAHHPVDAAVGRRRRVAGAAWSVKTEFSIIALIGVILLIGIVKKNAIMMIDFALDAEREQGSAPEKAIYEACLLRFRPIMMTTMAALLAALPLAIGVGDGAELRRPLGISIVGGLIVSQMLTLYTTPVVYLYLDRFRLWVLQARGRSLTPELGT